MAESVDGEDGDGNDVAAAARELASRSPSQSTNLPSTVILRERNLIRKQRKNREETTWTRHYFDVTTEEDTWYNELTKKRLQNRRWTCKLCGPAFSSTDKERHGNTSLLNAHMAKEHKFTKADYMLKKTPAVSEAQRISGSLMQYTAPVRSIPLPKEAALRFFALTDTPLDQVKTTAFQDLYRSRGTTAPFESRGALRNFCEQRFNDIRREQAAELQQTCETFSLSFDGWTAGNHKHILAAIAHWITPSFERRSMVVEFAEMTAGKSGLAMADVMWESLGPTFERTYQQITDYSLTTVTELVVGLDSIAKLFAVTGDNASNNDTFCDHLHEKLLAQGYDDYGRQGLSRCWFHGRKSRIRCAAHIIALVCDKALEFLGAGSYKETIALIQEVAENRGHFELPEGQTLSVWAKIRYITLWIQASGERRTDWLKICRTFIPLDVATRWNAVYLMMKAARLVQGNISKLVRSNQELKPFEPTEEDWALCATMERVLEPFYNHTVSVSCAEPCMQKCLGIFWGITDLLDDVANKEGRFGDVGEEIRLAFESAIPLLQEYNVKIRENIMYFAAHVLDPRFKTQLIEEQYGSEATEIVDEIKAYLKKQWPQQDQAAAPVQDVDFQQFSGIDIHTANLLRRAQRLQQNTNASDDIDAYFSSPTVQFDPLDRKSFTMDWILEWWRGNAFMFPTMAKAARALLAVPGAEVDIERLFCGGRDLLGVRRATMSGATMRILTLLKAHFQRLEATEKKAFLAQLPEVSCVPIGRMDYC